MSSRISATLLDSRDVHRGKILDLRIDTVRLPNGRETDLEVIRHPGAAAMAAVDENGEVTLVRQYRHATGGWILEVPAGKLDRGEPPIECARRELVEEIGRRAGELVELGWIWTTPGFTDERIWLFLARDLTAVEQDLDDDEVLEVERLPLAEAVERIYRGEIHDGKSVAALLLAARWLEREDPGGSPRGR